MKKAKNDHLISHWILIKIQLPQNITYRIESADMKTSNKNFKDFALRFYQPFWANGIV